MNKIIFDNMNRKLLLEDEEELESELLDGQEEGGLSQSSLDIFWGLLLIIIVLFFVATFKYHTY